MINEYLEYIQETESISFPKVEWDDVKEVLNSGKLQSTTRNSCHKNKIVFKVGQKYKTQWGDVVQIIKVQSFDDPKRIPTWNKMNKTMKKSIIYGIKMCGIENLQWVHLKKI